MMIGLRPLRSRVKLLSVILLSIALGASAAGCSKKTDTPAASSALTASQVKVALVPGGVHPYFAPWQSAGQQAKSEFGLGGVTFNETADWDQTKQNDLLQSLAAQGYNAFGVFGVSPDNINTTFGGLTSKHLYVASLGSCPAGTTDAADFCLATDVETAAYEAAKEAIRQMGGSGNLVHLTGNQSDSNTQRRIAGVDRAVAEANGKVKLLQTVTNIDADLQTAQKAVADLLAAKGGQINAIVNTAYNPSVASAAAVAAAHLPIKVVAIDNDPTVISGIESGTVSATVVQNSYGQAYIGSYVLMKLSEGCTLSTPGLEVDSGSFVVTKANVDTYSSLQQAKTAQLKSDFDHKYLICK